MDEQAHLDSLYCTINRYNYLFTSHLFIVERGLENSKKSLDIDDFKLKNTNEILLIQYLKMKKYLKNS